MFEINEAPKVGIKIFGKVYELESPSMAQAEKLQDYLSAEDKKGKEIKMMVNYFESLGLPKEVGYKLKMHQMQELAEFMGKPKKK